MLFLRASLFYFLFLICLFETSAQQRDSLLFKGIEISGNKRTKNFVIEREVPIKQGAYYSTDKISESLVSTRENLLNTGLFNFVNIEEQILGDNVKFLVSVEERWYFWPYPILEHADRNINAWLADDPLDRLNYGISFTQYNFRGRDEILRFKARFGYKEQFAAEYSSPAIDKKRNFGLTLKSALFRQHKAAVQTVENKLVYLENEDEFVKEYLDIEGGLIYRPKIYLRNYLTLGYTNINTSYQLYYLYPDYNGDLKNNPSFYKLRYTFILDKRDYVVFPTKGYLLRLSAENRFYDNDKSYEYFLTSVLNASKYSKIGERLFLANNISIKKSLDKLQPYFMIEGFGFEYNLRGYEYYVIDGNDFYLNTNSLYYNILPMKIRKFDFIPFNKFNKIHYSLYGNIFFDNGMVFNKYAKDDSMLKEFLFSFGAGIDLVTYYDRVFRVDFSVNKRMEKGIFLHFTAPI